MDFRFWWLPVLDMISTFGSGYLNENCYNAGVIDKFWDIFGNCNHIQDRGTFNCTSKRLEKLQRKNLPQSEQLHQLILMNCCLKTIDEDAFSNLTSLSLLDMSYNCLKVLDYKLFEQTKALSYLIISYNALDSVDYRLFSSIGNLSHLDLSHNNLKTFDHRLLKQQKQLIYINLECNNLYALHDVRLFTSQNILNELLMGNNLITTIDVNVLAPLNSITKIDLAGNPLVCQCHIKPTVDWCLNRSLESNALCVYPPEMKGKSWEFLSESPECQKNMSLELLPIKQATNEDLASRSLIKGLTISLGCIGLTVLVIIPVLLYFRCWKNRRDVRSGTTETVRRSSQELTDYQYYESVFKTGENNVASISSHNFLPPPSFDKEGIYDYVSLQNNTVTDSQDVTQKNNDSTDLLPTAEMVQNELYS